jgi:hypothetical protein
MENRHVGMMILGIALFLLLIVFSYNSALKSIVEASCVHGEACPMHATIVVQQSVSYGFSSLLLLVGLYMIFFMKPLKKSKHEEKEEIPKKTDFSNIDMSKLDDDEKKIVDILKLAKGSSYQSDIVKETDFSKVKVTRILDKLEGKKVIERKRRGMANIVILK